MGTKPHFPALDGLRGFAAVAVVIYHIGIWFDADYLAANGALAVDFFFCLSGFVLAFAYGQRLQTTMTAGIFMRMRTIRLMPMVILGVLIGGAYVLLRALIGHAPVDYAGFVLALILGMLCLPYLYAPANLGDGVFPLNFPQYTLFLELVVNAFWAATRRFHSIKLSVAITVGSFVLLCFTGIGGFATDTFLAGFPRVFASFYLGVLVFEVHRRIPANIRLDGLFYAGALLMAVLFFYPHHLSFASALFWIAVITPVIVLSGARTTLDDRYADIALLGGKLSFPLYALHYPVIEWLNGTYQIVVGARHPIAESVIFLLAIPLLLILLMRFYDEPLRRWLTRVFVKRSESPTVVARSS